MTTLASHFSSFWLLSYSPPPPPHVRPQQLTVDRLGRWLEENIGNNAGGGSVLLARSEFGRVDLCGLFPPPLCRIHLKCDGIRFRLSAKRTSLFKSAGASVQSTTGSRGVRISGSNAGYTMFRGTVEGTSYPLHPPISPSLPLPRVTVCHHFSTELYDTLARMRWYR